MYILIFIYVHIYLCTYGPCKHCKILRPLHFRIKQIAKLEIINFGKNEKDNILPIKYAIFIKLTTKSLFFVIGAQMKIKPSCEVSAIIIPWQRVY